MSNMKKIVQKKSNNKRKKAFITELRERGFNICGCRDCRSYRSDIVNISYKIAKKLKLRDGLSKKEYRDGTYSFAIDLACCILNPEYLVGLGEWEDGDDGKLIACEGSRKMILIHDYISEHSHLMNKSERRHFGENVDLITELFVCDCCKQDVA